MNKNIAFYVCILFSILLISILAPMIAPYNPEDLDMTQVFLPWSAEHLLGTDDLGRDVFSRLIFGGRVSIALSFLATLIASIIGLIVGLIAGYYGGKIDLIITGVSNLFQGLPGTTMLIALTGILGSGAESLLIAIPITSWVGFSRIVRGEVMRIKTENYIAALKVLGIGDLKIIFKHVLPNIFESIIILFTNKIGNTVITISSLSYLGFGLQPPTPDWGLMINNSRLYYNTAPTLILGPGICILLFVYSIHSIGNYMRDKMDSKSLERIY